MSESGRNRSSNTQEPAGYVASRHKLPVIAPPRPNSSYSSTISLMNTRASHTSWMNERNHMSNCPESGVYCPSSTPRNYPPAAQAHSNEESSPFSNVSFLKSALVFPKNDVQVESMDLSSSHESPVKKLRSSLNGESEKSSNTKQKSSPRKTAGTRTNSTNSPKTTRQTSSTKKLPDASSVDCEKPKLNSPKLKKSEKKTTTRMAPVPSDNVESALETLFNSDAPAASSVPVSTMTISNPQDTEESVEKILNSPPPCKKETLSNEDKQNDCDNSESSSNVRSRNKSSNKSSPQQSDSKKNEQTIAIPMDVDDNDRIIKNFPNIEIDTVEESKPEICKLNTQPEIISSPDKITSTTAVDTGSKKNSGKNEETAFVKVESELEKMFAGIEDNCAEKKGNPPDNSNTEVKSSNVQNSAPSNSSTGSKPARKKTSKKSKAPASKNSKETKAKSNSGKDSSVVDSAVAKRVPVIHIEGSKENPISIQIINSIKSEEDDLQDGKTSAKRKFAKYDRAAKKLATSHVVKNYDPANSDVSWICVFCKQCAYSIGLSGEPSGDLFGPYFITNPLEAVDESESKKHSKKTIHGEQTKKKQKRSLSESTDGFNSSSCEKRKSLEIWAHENCIVWASGIHLIGSKLIGLEQAVFEALETTCTHCNEKGASIGCRARHCKSCMHYSCAMYTGWNLNSETFVTMCNIHKVLN